MRWRRERHGSDVTGLKAEVGQLRAKLDALLALASEAQIQVESAARDAVEGVAPGLIVASRTVHSHGGEPVTLTFPGDRKMLAVVSGGNPELILRELSRRSPSRAPGGVLKLRHQRLVTGLDAFAVPEEGTVALTVSSLLAPAEQRVAVRTAMRAARRAGWLPSRVPAWIAAPLIFRRHGMAVVSGKVHAAIAGAAALTAGAVAVSTLMTTPVPTGTVRIVNAPPARAAVVHRARRRPTGTHAVSRRHRRLAVVAAAGATPQPSVQPPPQPQPQPSSSSSAPVPIVSASVSAPGQTCVWVLGIKVCLPV